MSAGEFIIIGLLLWIQADVFPLYHIHTADNFFGKDKLLTQKEEKDGHDGVSYIGTGFFIIGASMLAVKFLVWVLPFLITVFS